MNNKLKATNHFLERLWQRGFYLFNIERLTATLKPQEKKTLFIYSYKVLKQKSISIHRTEYLVVVVKDNALVTIFTITDIYEYLKTQSDTDYKFNSL